MLSNAQKFNKVHNRQYLIRPPFLDEERKAINGYREKNSLLQD